MRAIRNSVVLILMMTCVSWQEALAEISNCQCARKLKIGVSLPLTAGAISSGEAVRNSIILAKEKYDKNNCVDFIFEDDQLLAKNAVTNIRKFLSVDHVDGVIVYGTPTSIAVGPIIEEAKVPMIAMSILGKVVEGKSYIVKHWVTAERLTQAIAQEVKKRGYKKVAIVSTQNDAMLGLRDLFLDGKYAEVVVNDEFVRDNFDFRSTILRIIAKGADAVYVLLYPPQPGIFVKQLREQGYKGDAFGVHNIEDPKEVDASLGKMMGMWLANGDDTAGEGYRADYRKRFSIETSLGGGSGFDTAKMFIEAACNKDDINVYLHGIKNFQGSFGTYNATGKNDFDFSAVIKVIEQDGFKKIEP